MANDSKDQLSIEQQINAAIQARAVLMEQNKAGLADQIALAQELCRALECKELDGYQERMGELKSGLLAAADSSEELTDRTQEFEQASKKAAKSSFSMKAAAVGAFVAMKNAASGAVKVMTSIPGMVTGAIGGAFNILKMGMNAYNSMIDGLLQKSIELRNGSNAMRQAMEEVREEFGALHKGEGAAIIGTFENMGNTMKGTGTNMAKYFGSGSEGRAERLKMFQEVASGMGPVFTRLAGDFEEAGQEIMIASKALGMTGEGMAALALTGRKHGKTMKEVLQGVQKQVVQVSKAYGVNEKLTGKMLDQMAQAPEIFGTDTKEMLKMSVAAQKLGVSIETLGKTTKVFDDFESGAKAAAELAAQFGVTVDAMDMMTATPAEQVTMLKDALQESGQSFEEMSRQEKARMAELTGMDMSELQNLMDPTNAFDMDAMDDVDKGVDAATKATMQQTEATRALEKAIKRVTEAGRQMSGKGGFLGTFIDGLMHGIANSKEFKHILNNIYDTFNIVWKAGAKVGDKLAELMGEGGPLNFIMVWFDEMFDPVKMQKKMDAIVGFFGDFVNTVMDSKGDVSGAFTTLFNNIVDVLFGSGTSPDFFQKMIDGLAYFFDFVGASLIRFLPTILEALTNLFQAGIKLLTDGMPEMGSELATDGLFPMINSALADPKLVQAWDGMVEVFLQFVNVFWDKYGEQISDALGVVVAAIIGASLLKSLPIVLASGAIGGLVKGLFGAIGGALGGPAAGAAGAAGADPSQSKGLQKVAEGIKSTVDVLKTINPKDIGKAALVMGLIGAAFGVALLAFVGVVMAVEATGVSSKMMLTMAAVSYGVAKAGEALGALIMGISKVRFGAKEIAVVVLILGLLIGVVWAVSKIVVNTVEALSGITPPDPKTVEAAGSITQTIMTAVAGIVVLAGVLAGIALLASNPITGTIVAAALVAAGVIFWAVGGLMIDIVKRFGKVNETTAKKASIAAEASAKLTESLMGTLDLLQKVILGLSLNPFTFQEAAVEVASVVDVIADEMMPAMKRAADTITEDPSIIREKLGIIIDLMNSFAPIAELMTAALSIKDMGPEDIATAVDSVSSGIESILTNVAGMVTGIVDKIGAMSPQQIEAAKAAAPMIQAVASLLGAFAMPTELLSDKTKIINQRIETGRKDASGWGTGDEVTYGTKQVEKTLMTASDRQREYINNFVYMLEQIGPALQKLVAAMASVKIPGDPKNMEAKMKTMSAIMNALSDFGNALGAIGEVGLPSEIQQKVEYVAVIFGRNYKYNSAKFLVPAIQGVSDLADELGAIGNIPKKIAAITRVIKDLDPLLKTMKYMTDVSVGVQKMSKLFEEFYYYQNTLTVERGKVGLAAGIKAIASVSDQVSSLTFGGLDNIGDMLTQMTKLTPKIKRFSKRSSAAMWEPLVDVVTAFNEMGVEMGAATNIVDIESQLKAIGKALKITGKKVTVERGDVQITVNLNVGLEAAQLSQVLVYNGLVWKGPRYGGTFNDADRNSTTNTKWAYPEST